MPLNAIGSVAGVTPNAKKAGPLTARTSVRAGQSPYLGKEASYSGSTAIPVVSQSARGNVGRQGQRAALQFADDFNAKNAGTDTSAQDAVVAKLDSLASRYNALVRDYRENPYLTDPLSDAMKDYWDALATTELPKDAPRETQIFQEMVRQTPKKASQEQLNAQGAYFGNDLYGKDYQYDRYSPLLPYSDSTGDYYGAFQRQLVQRLLDEKLIPTEVTDKLASDVAPWKDFTTPVEPREQQMVGRPLTPQPPSANVSLKFQDVDVPVSDRDVYYNPRDHAYGFGNIFYDVFGGRAANSTWGAVADNGMQDLMFPDAPYTLQGYKGHWIGNGDLNTQQFSKGGASKRMTIPDEVPISPLPGERQVYNRQNELKPLITETKSDPRLLANLTPWTQANQAGGGDTNQGWRVGPVDPRMSGRSPMFDVPQNWVTKPFDNSSWEPYAFDGITGTGQHVGIQRAGGPGLGYTMDSLQRQFLSNFNGSDVGFGTVDTGGSGFNPFIRPIDLTPLPITRDQRLSLGYGE